MKYKLYIYIDMRYQASLDLIWFDTRTLVSKILRNMFDKICLKIK